MNTIAETINMKNTVRLIFWSVVSLLVLFSIMYAFFVKQTVINIVERENFENEIAVLNSEVSGLEFKYIALKNEVDMDYAHSVGFVDVKNMKFASRKLPAQNLSLKTE
ncbi:hypothetical protein A3I18_02210 [Candidatus Campbellbacteria bacterium RIFCSPLOWO2_02_FULL_35_11]|uniref:Uncharacterized protein n=2 Tax=Candidatus Campbelliibacteriota TaxID=1752727 RepID=A0A1F5EKQ0_9BACT|nr:MAG: hypothetical protein A3E89_02340 [Candidatus Campbellbacteria bacterium RIFCSPHIGHO2_12_FULL_35_10]OGD69831.1 MAG: hypothetical protein A3I18_02210 [Candidatus Campbellbacteria bacterium RIFCSPLOWO2_02_FULL_35_11]